MISVNPKSAASRGPISHKTTINEPFQAQVATLQEHPRNIQIYGDESIDDTLVASIKDNGVLTPLLVTDDMIVLSGHRRLRAAKDAGLERVPVQSVGALSENLQLDILLDANNQREKTNWQMLQETAAYREVAEEKARLRMHAGAINSHGGKESIPDPGQSRDDIGKKVGASGRQVSKFNRIEYAYKCLKAEGRDDEAEKLKALTNKSVAAANRLDIVAVYNSKDTADTSDATHSRVSYSVSDWKNLEQTEQNRLLAHDPTGKYTLNAQKSHSIEWAQFSWNPITGCQRACNFCYARDLVNRFHNYDFSARLHPERLVAPYNTAVPDKAVTDPRYRNVFVCSMADLFGTWVPQEWIDTVFQVVRDNPQWQFLFLSKFPKNLSKQHWPSNAQVGTTVTVQNDVELALRAMTEIKEANPETKTWLSIEPMLERLQFDSLKSIDQLVIGGASRSTETPAFRPPYQWVKPLLTQIDRDGGDYFLKTNLEFRPNGWMGHDAGNVPDRAPDVFFPKRSAPDSEQTLGKSSEIDASVVPAYAQEGAPALRITQ